MTVSAASWITGASFQADSRLANVTLPPGMTYDQVAQAATDVLFLMSGSRYPGISTDTIRPHKIYDRCTCNFAAFTGWSGSGIGGWFNRVFPEGWPCTCPSPTEYLMPNSPVLVDGNGNLLGGQILVDGQLLAPTDYRVYDQRRLVRLAGSINGAYSWPCCQWLRFDTSQPGTWSITYQHGAAPPQSGLLAVRELAIEFALLIGGGQSKIPARVKTMQRQGVTIDVVNATDALKQDRFGILLIDAFLRSVNPKGYRRRMQVFSPDVLGGARQ